jgi:hypothetical protein
VHQPTTLWRRVVQLLIFFIAHKRVWKCNVVMMSKQNFIQQHPSPVLKTPDGQKQLHIIGVEQHTDLVENHRYSVDKPNETQWSEMTPLWDTRCHPDILESAVADSYSLNYPCMSNKTLAIATQ